MPTQRTLLLVKPTRANLPGNTAIAFGLLIGIVGIDKQAQQ
ncbi:MAG: hypothetical protein PVF75_00005 [Granulosicoccaceae bacterium]|jgi:hypothetical protein